MVILVLEDDDDYAEIIAHTLRRGGHEVVVTNTVAAALNFARHKEPAAAVLDVLLPDGSGLDACLKLRERLPKLPVLFLSSLDRSTDVLSGFEAGGDDYLIKPFTPSELLARVRAVLRRSGADVSLDAGPTKRIESNGLELDQTSQSAAYRGTSLNLTPLEVDVLWQLVRYPGQALSHAFLTEQIWGYKNVNDATLLKGHVSSIRRKLRDAGGQEEMIRTVHGVGYSFTPV
ncbi:MAG TPA: response regulator transcription factor [Gemmataceae bacterium]|jgi:DNA-binding response OmpR family regulator|nr:response regulator transcription factor [Gemmataceae bacterium]